MKKFLLPAILIAYCFITNAQATPLTVKLIGIENDKTINPKFAYCMAKNGDKSSPGLNISPAISWEKGPEGTKSYAVIVVDRDVPTNFDNANKDGKTILSTAPRQNFYHWLLVNVPMHITSIPEGAGKDAQYGDQLVNDFFKFSGAEKNPQTIQKYSGYDGPCPPWNDERIHYYHYKVYALSERFSPGENYSGDEIIRTITPYILAEGDVVGSYTLNQKISAEKAAGDSQIITPTIKVENAKKDSSPSGK